MMNVTGEATASGQWLDRAAIGLSGLCVVHCLSTAVVFALLASAGGAVGHHAIHSAGLLIAILLATLGLGRGILLHGRVVPASVAGLGLGVMAGALAIPHGSGETVYTILGVVLVALGHDLNRRALV